MAAYDKNYGNVCGAPQAPPSWGHVPTSMASTLTPSYGYNPYAGTATPVSSDAYSQYSDAFTQAAEYKDPKEEAEAQLKKMKKKERRKKRKTEDAHTAASALMVISVLSALAWIVPCFGNGWHRKMFAGFGLKFAQICTGLFTIDIIIECHAMGWPFGIDSNMMNSIDPEQRLCKVFQSMNGTHNMMKAKDLACVMEGTNSCNIMRTITYASFFLLFAFVTSALLSLIAGLFLYYYWFIEHLKEIRNWAMGLFGVAPILGMVAFLTYSLLMPDLGDLFRSWNAFAQGIAGPSGFGTIKPIGEDVIWNKYGWCWFFMFISIGTAVSGPVVWGMWFLKHPDEKEHELAAAIEIGEIEDAIEAVYCQEDRVRENAAYHSSGAAAADAAAYANAAAADRAYASGAYGASYPAAAYPSAGYGTAGYGAYGAAYSNAAYAGAMQAGNPYAQGYPGSGY